MAKSRKYQNRSQKENGQSKIGKGLAWFLSILVLFAIAVSINTVVPFSDNIPTWHKLAEEFDWYSKEANKGKPTIPTDGGASIHFIDVRQGNAVLIMSDDATMLIDAGEVDQGKTVVDYLKKFNIDKLDYLIASHPHSDHIGGMDEVLYEVEVDNLIMPNLREDLIPTTRVYRDLLTAIESVNPNVLEAKTGDEYTLGQGSFTVLGPNGDFDDLNELSAGVKFTYGEQSVLTTGDIGKKAERAMIDTGLDLTADILQMSHHGSKYSNSEDFLASVNATYYVAQMGYGNEYGHPHNEAVDRVKKLGGKLYRSDLYGDIVFSTDGQELTIQAELE